VRGDSRFRDGTTADPCAARSDAARERPGLGFLRRSLRVRRRESPPRLRNERTLTDADAAHDPRSRAQRRSTTDNRLEELPANLHLQPLPTHEIVVG
jgi:hypothetical protein